MAPCTVLWTLTLVAGCWAQGLWVSQPSWAQGPEGGSVTLRCSYHSPRAPRLGSYAWEKEVGGAWLEVSDGRPEFRGRVRRTGERSFLQERRADLELHHLRPYDNGTYRCLVNIPLVGQAVGNGTWLQVLPAVPALDVSSDKLILLWLFLRGLVCTFGLITSALGAALFYQRQRARRRRRRPGQRPAKPQMPA
ncbi:natural cytotoxicity triggering receptor 3-like [Carettochelys insculpta]|uniref:natural cytotoxicity triggering receptor 3-like n=1 Tax=Carettochelys insculpta TaxID=44489 RepID=UPI003EB82D08